MRAWASRLSACLFLLQTLLIGFTLGAHAAPRLHDQFGNVICTDSRPGNGLAGKPAGHDDQHACCVLGCSAAAVSHWAPAPSVASLAITHTALRLLPQPVWEDRRAGIIATPRNTRAPPFAL